MYSLAGEKKSLVTVAHFEKKPITVIARIRGIRNESLQFPFPFPSSLEDALVLSYDSVVQEDSTCAD